MGGHLFILTGPSGCGKTTLLNEICNSRSYREAQALKAPKFSERASRGPSDDVTSVDKIELGDFDLAYVINGIRYGIKVDEIRRQLAAKHNSFIILSDFRIVRRLKLLFGNQAKAVYIASSVDIKKLESIQEARYGFNPSDGQRRRLYRQFSRLESAARLDLWKSVFECMGELATDWKEFIPQAKSTEIRAQKIRAFHNRYVDNLHLFDHVLLNYNEGHPEEMASQMVNITKYYNIEEGGNRSYQRPVLFVVAASSGAGKATLMETLNSIGRDQIAIITKMARRDPKPNDKRDGMIAIGKDGAFPEEFDMRWSFHEPLKKDVAPGEERDRDRAYSGTEYAISTIEVNDNFRRGVHQIVISNMGQFSRFRTMLPNRVVFLYLHRMVSAREIRSYQLKNCKTKEEAQQRIFEISEVHKEYIERIPEFNHVLLNTAYPEDLYDQMFQLMDYYSK